MKRKVLILIFSTLSIALFAQRGYDYQCRVDAKYSYAMAPTLTTFNPGYFSQDAMLSFSQFIPSGKWQVGVSYADLTTPITSGEHPLKHQQMVLQGGYDFKAASNYKQNFMLFIGANALLGYEMVKDEISQGLFVEAQDRFLYGATIQISLEYYVARNLGFTLTLSERFTFGSQVSYFRTYASAGITVLFN